MHLTKEQYKIQERREGKQSTFTWLGQGNYRQQASALKLQAFGGSQLHFHTGQLLLLLKEEMGGVGE